MDKKKIIKIILIILAVIIALVLIHTTRNFCILTSIANTQAKFENYTNYSFTISTQQENSSAEIAKYFKDNIIKQYYTVNGTTFMVLWANINTNEYIALNEEDKSANISPLNNKSTIHELVRSVFATGDNIANRLYLSLVSFISIEELNGQKCYLINQSNKAKYYINKENKVEMRRVFGDYVMNFKNIRLNDLTDNDVAKPDLTGYTVSTNN